LFIAGSLVACQVLSEVGPEEVKKDHVGEIGERTTASAPEGSGVMAFDGFDGKLRLKWNIVNPDASHYSLSEEPGALTIATQEGGLSRFSNTCKNVFIIESPAAAGEDFEITTCLSAFRPLGDWNQAGLVCYNDDDNYLKGVCEWSFGSMGMGQRVLTLGRETDGQASFQWFAMGLRLDKVWLRLKKQGNRFEFSTSSDGKSFRHLGSCTWGDGSVKRVGLLAKNGPGSKAPEVDASFDFFEFRSLKGD
jgi:hypothetical protein